MGNWRLTNMAVSDLDSIWKSSNLFQAPTIATTPLMAMYM